eukprot:gene21873-28905_t
MDLDTKRDVEPQGMEQQQQQRSVELDQLCAHLICELLPSRDLQALREVSTDWNQNASHSVRALKPRATLNHADVLTRSVTLFPKADIPGTEATKHQLFPAGISVPIEVVRVSES